MSSTYDTGKCLEDKPKKECPDSPTKEHKYECISGSWPSMLMQCVYCKNEYYTK